MDRRAGFVVVALVGALGACSSEPATLDSSTASSSHRAEGARLAKHSVRSHPPTVVASPPAPPFGYCGGLQTTSDASYITTSGEAVALVEADTDGQAKPIPHVTRLIERNPVTDVRILAGSLPGSPLSEIDSPPLKPGRYLLVVGGGKGGYFVSMANYGTYAVHGRHAYRTCYDYSGAPPHLVRHGITTISGLIDLFSRALK
ncbi:MAG TPA: hypothetical protein VGH69_11465 [Mycobacterium sp.]|jgi:hypothetical protein